MGVLFSASACQGGEPEAFRRGMEAMQKGDYAEAFCLWKPLAEQGHTDAEYHLGWFYANGYGLRVNMEKAVYWWSRAAEQGHVDSQYALAMAYSSGEGMEPNPEQAVHWLWKAAHQGNEDAQDILRERLAAGAPELDPLVPSLVDEPWVAQVVQVRVESANVRAAPSIDAELVTKLERGDQVLWVQRKGDWVYVLLRDPKRSAWVYAPLLTRPAEPDEPDDVEDPSLP